MVRKVKELSAIIVAAAQGALPQGGERWSNRNDVVAVVALAGRRRALESRKSKDEIAAQHRWTAPKASLPGDAEQQLRALSFAAAALAASMDPLPVLLTRRRTDGSQPAPASTAGDASLQGTDGLEEASQCWPSLCCLASTSGDASLQHRWIAQEYHGRWIV
jgi:hypothetical protein